MKPASIWILSPSIHEMSYYHDDITMLRAKFNQSSTQHRGRPPTRRLFLGDAGVPEAGTRGFRYLMLAYRSGVESGSARLAGELPCDISQPNGLDVNRQRTRRNPSH